MNVSNLTLDLLITNFVVGVLLPFLVDLVVKWKAPAPVKILINLAFSAVTGVLTPLIVLPHVDWRVTLLAIVQTFLTSVVSHVGVLRPAGVTGDQGVVLRAIPGGIGKSTGSVRKPPRHKAKAA